MELIAGLIVCASLSAIDGDSIRCNDENMRIMGSGAPHVSGVDTPELRGACPAEKMMAQLAKARLAELLTTDGVQIEFSGERDKTQTQRPLVWVRLQDGKTAGQVLIDEGYALEWRRGRTIDWCGSADAS